MLELVNHFVEIGTDGVQRVILLPLHWQIDLGLRLSDLRELANGVEIGAPKAFFGGGSEVGIELEHLLQQFDSLRVNFWERLLHVAGVTGLKLFYVIDGELVGNEFIITVLWGPDKIKN